MFCYSHGCVCIVRVAVVGLSEAFKLAVFSLLLVPDGGQTVVARCSAAGVVPRYHGFILSTWRTGWREHRAGNYQTSLYILQSWPAPLCCAPLRRLSQGQAGANESNTLLMDYGCVCICGCVDAWDMERTKKRKGTIESPSVGILVRSYFHFLSCDTKWASMSVGCSKSSIWAE